MSKLKMIQVGTGGWGKSWLGFLDKAPDWEVSALVSRGGDNLEQARAVAGLPESACYQNLDDALATDADAVLVTIPHHLHVGAARRALKAGKHVLCEKPFSSDFAEARELVAFAETTDRVLAISQNFRYRLGLHQLKALTTAGAGSIDSMQVELRVPQGGAQGKTWRTELGQSPLLLEILIHQVDMARYLCGSDPVGVLCRAWNPSWSLTDTPVSADVLVDYDNGIRLSYSGTWASRGKRTSWDGEWRIRYENAFATWSGEDVDLFSEGNESNPPIPTVPEFPGHDRDGVLVDFAKAVRGQAPFPTSGKGNLASLAIIFAAIKSSKESRWVGIEEIMRG